MESIVQMDQFTYHYKPKTNQLTHINDLVDAQVFGNTDDNYASVDIDNQPNNNYQYDEIGQLISDQSEGISLIEWRVDGKVKSITKTGNQPSLRFYYDGLGNRVAKKVMNDPANGAMTYYTRDAQGNTMASYKIGIANSGVIKNVLDEHTIYGSSRLGVQSYTPYDVPQDYHRLVGDKRYELSNHLGNVLNVVNDRKLVASGVKTIHTNFFDTERWRRIGVAGITLTDTHTMNVNLSNINDGAFMQIGLQSGTNYIFQLDVMMDELPANAALLFAIRDTNMNILDSQVITASTNINKQYLAMATGVHNVTITLNSASIQPASFYIDNYYVYSIPANGQDFVSLFMPDVLAHNDYYPFGMLVPNRFESVEDYRYGFNGKEKDDEVKGKGNSIDFGERLYDGRAGRWWSTDNYLKPWISSYQFASDNPINNIDPDGNDEIHFYYRTEQTLDSEGKAHIVLTLSTEIIKNDQEHTFFMHSPTGATTQFHPFQNNSLPNQGSTAASDNQLPMSQGISWFYGLFEKPLDDYAYLGRLLKAAPEVMDHYSNAREDAMRFKGAVNMAGSVEFTETLITATETTYAIVDGYYLLKGLSKFVVKEYAKASAKIGTNSAGSIVKIKKPYSTSRPAYGKTQVDDVWEAAKQKDGKAYDPNTGEELIWSKEGKRNWDMGHKPGKEYKKIHQDYMDGKITKEQFLKEYQNPKNYQPEAISPNRSHKYEQK